MSLAQGNANGEKWLGRRYYPISQYFKNKFGVKTAKIPVSIAERCPMKADDGRLQPCIFCDEYGSAAYHLEVERDLLDQIRHNRKAVDRRLNGRGYLVYFQSYTNTLDKVAILKQRFDIALSEDYISGLVIGTRADCLPARMLPMLQTVADRSYLMVEIGVQSFFDDQLDYIKRGHKADKNIEAIHKLSQLQGVDIGIHLIFGIPGDSAERIIETARIINGLPISNVKLHNLHVLRNTPLHSIYQRGEFEPDDLEIYAEKVILFLRHLSPETAVQRLAAVASRWDDLIAPKWTGLKMQPVEFIEKRMRDQGIYQGDLYEPAGHSDLRQRPLIAISG